MFVIGAGASFELGLPLGTTLLEEIGSSLNYTEDHFGRSGDADRRIYRELELEAQQRQVNVGDYMRAAWRVRDAAHLGLSIDNVIHQQNDDPLFAWCGKLAIAQRILTAESKSSLRLHDNQRRITWPEVRGTWLGGFAQLLVQDVEKKNVAGIFDNVSVVSFNYDRTIKRFLPFALSSQFALSNRGAEELTSKLRVFHPYGSLGSLPWEGRVEPVEFGCQRCSLASVAKNILTFTEGVEDDENLDDMKSTISKAKRVVFLGFGYLAQNMELISRNVDGQAEQVLGTSFGLSDPDQELVKNQLSFLFHERRRSYKDAQLSPKKCAAFIRENFRTLTS